MRRENNRGLYRELNKPFTSLGEFDAAVTQFSDVVRAARVTAKLPDVYVIICASAQVTDGETQVITGLHFGNELLAEGLTAWAYGKEQAEHRELIGRMLAAMKTPA